MDAEKRRHSEDAARSDGGGAWKRLRAKSPAALGPPPPLEASQVEVRADAAKNAGRALQACRAPDVEEVAGMMSAAQRLCSGGGGGEAEAAAHLGDARNFAELAHRAREFAWQSPRPRRVTSAQAILEVLPDAVAASLAPFLRSRCALIEVCGAAAERACGQAKEAALWLAAAHYHIAALLGLDGAADADAALDRSISRLLSASAATQPPALAAACRALHGALAAARVADATARCLAPALLRCVAAGQGAEAGAEAAAALLGLVAHCEEPVQGEIVDDIAGASSSFRSKSAVQQRHVGRLRNRAPHAPGAFTALVLRMLPAACLPVRLPDAAPTAAKAVERWRTVESRAATLAGGIVKQGLLAVRDRDADPSAWSQLECFTQELLENCTDSAWVAAPLLLLSLARALSRVAAASKCVDLAWTQREFAVRLLGQIAEALCREDARWSGDGGAEGGGADLQALRGFLESEPQEVVRRLALPAPGDAGEGACLLAAHAALAPSACCGAPRVAGDPADERRLELSALPAAHPALASGFLLCAQAALQAATAAAPKKRGRREAAAEAAQPSAVRAWDAMRRCRATGRGAPGRREQRSAVEPHVARLYRRTIDADLGRARLVALEALQAQLRGSALAFVRRQAAAGLGAACLADPRLAASRAVGRALALALQDDSQCVRTCGVEAMGRLLAHSGGALPPERVAECRTAVAAFLGDASMGVRRAAYRAICATLDAEAPGFPGEAADLLLRLQQEDASQVHDAALAALERALLSSPRADPARALGTLVDTVAAATAAVAAGAEAAETSGPRLPPILLELFRAHFAARGERPALATFQALAAHAAGRVAGGERLRLPAVLVVLEQLSAAAPASLHGHLQVLASLLEADAPAASSDALLLAQQACRILSAVLPGWAAAAAPAPRQRLGAALRRSLGRLLRDQGSCLTRNAAECLCVVSMHLVDAAVEDVQQLMAQSTAAMEQCLKTEGGMDGPSQRRLCRHAWVLGTISEHLDLGRAARASQMMADGVAAGARLLVTMCLRGPPSLRPSLVPCLGFLLRRHFHFLLGTAQDADALHVFRAGLSVPAGGAGHDAVSVQTVEKTLGAMASLLECYVRIVEAQPPAGHKEGGRDWGAVVAESLRKPKISEVVQRLAGLQPEVLNLLRVAGSAEIFEHAITTLACLHRLGVLHSASALPDLIAASIAGFQTMARTVRRFLMRMVEFSPQLLLSRVSVGLRIATARLAAQQVPPGALGADRWRSTFFFEAYAALAESRKSRERFLDVLLGELGAGEAAASAPKAQEMSESLFLLHAELVVALLLALPYRGELEVAFIVSSVSRVLALLAAPLLLADGGVDVCSYRHHDLLRICTRTTLLHELCQHLCGGSPATLERLISVGHTIADGGALEDRPLPTGFSRRQPPDVSKQLGELHSAAKAKDAEALRTVVLGRISLDSPLLRVGAHPAAGAGACARRKGNAERPKNDSADAKEKGKRRCKSKETTARSGKPSKDVALDAEAADVAAAVQEA